MRTSIALMLFTLAAAGLAVGEARAQASDGQRIIVTVNDQPITNYDVTQRVRLNDVLGSARGNADQKRKDAIQDLIDDVIKRSEAKKNQIEPTDKQVTDSVDRLAKNMGTTTDGLGKSLQAKGISMTALKDHIKASLSFNWIMTKKHNIKVEVDQAEVDRRFANITSDPRLKPVEIYEIVEIQLPVEATAGAMLDQLLYARAVEAQQIVQRYTGCASARKAAEGIFNVKVGKPIQAEASRIPAEMKNVLVKGGTSRLIGPMRGKNAVQLVGFCGRKTLSPPKPTRNVVEELVKNEKYRIQAERIMRDLRRSAFIDYKSASATQ